MKKQFLLLLLGLCVAMFLGACSKTESVNGGTAQLDLRLTDAPGPFDALYLDIQGVEFHTDGAGWIRVEAVVPDVYNLLEFRNGLDTLVARVTLPAGRLSQVRFLLGENNSIVVDGIEHELKIPSGQQSGLKFNVHQELIPDGSYTVWTDFDAARSIVKTGNESYILKPVIRVFTELTNGRIRGMVKPMTANPIVYAMGETDTATAIPNMDGFFLISGLPEGDYMVVTKPDTASGLAPDTIAAVPVKFGIIADVGTIALMPATGQSGDAQQR